MTDTVEEFGVEEFGAEPEAEGDDPAELKALIEDLTKQIAATMNAGEAETLRQAKRAAQERLDGLTKPTGLTERQWVDLSEAWDTMFGKDAFTKRIQEYGGITNGAYHQLTRELSEAHAAGKKPGKPAVKRGRKPKEEQPKQQDCGPEPTPQERWPHIVQHAKQLGFDANVVFDELGFTELTHDTVGRTLVEVNRRGNPQPEESADEVEEFGAGETAPAVPIVSVPATAVETTSPPANAAPGVTGARIQWDERLKKAIEVDTGEVITVNFFLEALGIAELPTEPDRELAAKILDVMHTYYLAPAARYREQAEKLAAPLDARAKQMEEFWGPYLDTCGDKFLPRYGARAKEENRGKLSAKTLDLITGSISWRKSGGIVQSNSGAYFVWLQEMRDRLYQLSQAGTVEAAEEIVMLNEKYGLRLETKAVADNDKIKTLTKDLPPGWEKTEVNEFAVREIK